MNPDGRGGKEEIGRVGGRKTIMGIYYIRKKVHF